MTNLSAHRTHRLRLHRGRGAAFGKVHIGALIISIGFWAHYTTVTIRFPHNSIGNYLGTFIMPFGRSPEKGIRSGSGYDRV